MTKIVYIAGYGHSGSTLYGVVLGGLQGNVNAGELHRLGTFKKVPRLNEPFISPELERARVRLKKFIATADPAFRKIAALESIFSIRVRDAQRSTLRYNKFWGGVMDIIAQETGAEVLIDSSKTAWGQVQRPQLLRDAGHDIFLLHLVKDPQALVCSRTKKKGLINGAKSLLGWSITNWLTWRRYRAWGSRYMISIYDDFARSPQAELEIIGKFIGQDLAPSKARIEAGLGFASGLQFGGNRAGRHREVFWDPDLRSRREAAPLPRLIGAVGLPLFHYLKMRQRDSEFLPPDGEGTMR